LRWEDEIELCHSFTPNFRDKFIEISLNAKEKYFLSDKNDNPLVVGGVETKKFKKLKIGRVWIISTNHYAKNKLKLAKFIRERIEDFKKRHDILFNIIYKSNYSALKWLTKCGFRVMELNCDDYKLFYYTRGGINFDLRYITR